VEEEAASQPTAATAAPIHYALPAMPRPSENAKVTTIRNDALYLVCVFMKLMLTGVQTPPSHKSAHVVSLSMTRPAPSERAAIHGPRAEHPPLSAAPV
jgi:hypothetical protein